MKTDAADKASFLRRFHLNTPTRESLHRQLFRGSLYQSVSRPTMDSRYEYSSSFGNNEIAERAVRRVNQGTGIAMVPCGPPDQRWDRAMDCCCFLRHAHDNVANGNAAYENRFGVTCTRPWTLFGANVSCRPMSRLHQFEKKKRCVLEYAEGHKVTCPSPTTRTWEDLSASEMHVQAPRSLT